MSGKTALKLKRKSQQGEWKQDHYDLVQFELTDQYVAIYAEQKGSQSTTPDDRCGKTNRRDWVYDDTVSYELRGYPVQAVGLVKWTQRTYTGRKPNGKVIATDDLSTHVCALELAGGRFVPALRLANYGGVIRINGNWGAYVKEGTAYLHKNYVESMARDLKRANEAQPVLDVADKMELAKVLGYLQSVWVSLQRTRGDSPVSVEGGQISLADTLRLGEIACSLYFKDTVHVATAAYHDVWDGIDRLCHILALYADRDLRRHHHCTRVRFSQPQLKVDGNVVTLGITVEGAK